MSFRITATLILFISFLFSGLQTWSQQTQRPKIGLTLSGGGAKGLAHIGILKAIDSAGLQVDYVTGTSMGAIVGSLYAVGYSGDSILQIARGLNWNVLLSNKSPLNAFIMEEKNEYGRYALELPMQSGKFILPSGVLEAEELWLKFNELYSPVYGVRDFSQLNRPFKCIATDLETGEAVVLENGDLISAVRASMAIPSVFTAVTHGGKKLVDGGIIRNFPVSDVRKMGADIVIGSNVSTGLQKAEKINTLIQILMQIAFFKEAELSKEEIALCDYYIDQPVEKYNSASFNYSDSLIEIGLKIGDQYYPYFRKLADSLKAIYGQPQPVAFPEVNKKITLRHILSDSLKYISKPFLRKMLGLKEGAAYSVKDLEAAIRQAYGTRYFNRLYYQLHPVTDGVADLQIIAEENAPVAAKLAVNFNTLSNIMLIANLSVRDFFGKNSRTSATFGLSENTRIRLEHIQVFSTKKLPLAWISELYLERQDLPTYANYKPLGLSRETSIYFDSRLQLAFKRRQLYAAGIHRERVNFRPQTVSLRDIDGKNSYMQAYMRYEYNSHDRLFLPRKGTYFLFEPSFIFAQSPDATFKANGVPYFNIDSLGLKFGSFGRLKLQVQKVLPVRSRQFLTLQAEAGANFTRSQFIFHDFLIGGMTPVMRNQVSFAGLQDAAVNANSLVKGAINWRYHFTGSVYAAASFNLMYHSFLEERFDTYPNNILSGYGLTLGIDSPIGPLEFSFMYSDQSQRLKNYVNLGFKFSRQMF